MKSFKSVLIPSELITAASAAAAFAALAEQLKNK